VLLVSTLAVGCITADAIDPSLSPVASPSTSLVSSEDAREHLLELSEAWLRTSATINYATTGHVPGQPPTAHLCLRQLADRDYGEKKRAALLRRCSRQGHLRLVWDPPDGWRMDVITPVDRFTLTSADGRTRICRFEDLHDCRAIHTADAIDQAGAAAFFRSPERILGEVGASDVRPIESPDDTIVPVECFAASGSDEHVEWCYASNGMLVSFLRGSGATGWESVEARDVS